MIGSPSFESIYEIVSHMDRSAFGVDRYAYISDIEFFSAADVQFEILDAA